MPLTPRCILGRSSRCSSDAEQVTLDELSIAQRFLHTAR
jgi:hypothetical protein